MANFLDYSTPILDYSNSSDPGHVVGSTGFGGFSSADVGAGLSAAGDLFSGLTGFLGDQAKSAGLKAESQAYTTAAGYAAGDVQLAEESKLIKEYQTQRKVSQVTGAQEAGVGGAGFTEGGSALSLLRESMSQGALATGLVNVQGEQQAQGYRAQQAADIGLAAQANTAAKAASSGGIGDILGGVLKAGSALIPFL